jgi:hypothetical protein
MTQAAHMCTVCWTAAKPLILVMSGILQQYYPRQHSLTKGAPTFDVTVEFAPSTCAPRSPVRPGMASAGARLPSIFPLSHHWPPIKISPTQARKGRTRSRSRRQERARSNAVLSGPRGA